MLNNLCSACLALELCQSILKRQSGLVVCSYRKFASKHGIKNIEWDKWKHCFVKKVR